MRFEIPNPMFHTRVVSKLKRPVTSPRAPPTPLARACTAPAPPAGGTHRCRSPRRADHCTTALRTDTRDLTGSVCITPARAAAEAALVHKEV